MSKLQKIDGVRLKVRTYKDGDGSWVAAFVAIDGELKQELGRRSMLVELDPGSTEHQEWVSCMRALFRAFLVQVTGEEGIATKLQAPNYKGE